MSIIELIEQTSESGAWNMAADEWLMSRVTRSGIPALRVYRWSQPTLSLGYFQQAAARQLHPASQPCPWVRRASGGGAILHHHEFTYALAMPCRSRRGFAQPLYDLIHEALVDELSARGLRATRFEPQPQGAPVPTPFLCFMRRAPGDVLLEDHKILGSAQRRSATAVLQHGSLLCRRSPFAPELPGICDLAARPVEPEELVPAWLDRISARMGGSFEPRSLADLEGDKIDYLAVHKFGADRWNQRR